RTRHSAAGLTEKACLLALIFGDADAAAKLRERAADATANPAARQRALQALVQARAPALVPLLQSLVRDGAMRPAAIRGLAAFDDPATPNAILGAYDSLVPEEKAVAITTLASRPSYAVALLEAVKR